MKHPKARAFLPVLATLLLLLHALHYRATWTDDAYITFRYVRNLVAGDGLTFNPGERLEGITNVGWALLLAPFAGGDLLAAARVLSLLGGAGSLFLLSRWSQNLKTAMSAASLSATLVTVVLVPWVPFWTMQGLETVGAMFLVTAAWTLYRDPRGTFLAALALGLAPAIRPDTAVLALTLGAWHLWRRGPWNRQIFMALGVVLFLAAALVALKLWCFGEILPNTFYVKTGAWPPARGLSYLENFFSVPSPALPILLSLALLRGLAWAFLRDPRGLPSVVTLTAFGAAVGVDGDFMPNYRFFVPAWPAAAAALGLFLEDLSGRIPRAWRTLGGLCLGGLLAVALLPEIRTFSVDQLDRDASGSPALPKRAPFLQPWTAESWAKGLNGEGPFAAAWTLVNANSGAVAYTDIGLLSYLNEVAVVDLLGLTDRVMAGREGRDPAKRSAYLDERVAFMIVEMRQSVWAEQRTTLKEGGWAVIDGCEGTWVFANPRFERKAPSEAELQRRLDLALERVPENADLHVAIARELYAVKASSALLSEWLDAMERVSPLAPATLGTLRCEAGVGPAGCRETKATCERGGPRVDPTLFGDTRSWPGIVGPDGKTRAPPPSEEARGRPEDAKGPPLSE